MVKYFKQQSADLVDALAIDFCDYCFNSEIIASVSPVGYYCWRKGLEVVGGAAHRSRRAPAKFKFIGMYSINHHYVTRL